MKTLFLIRHAKASWEMPGVDDSERPLLTKGIQKTHLIIDFLKEKQVKPDLIISSPAIRAHETAKIMAAGLGYPVSKIHIERKIYEGFYDRILDVIYGVDNKFHSVMIFGHNPTITQVANLFLHPGIDSLSTSGVVSISFDTGRWEEIPSVEARQEFVVIPRMLKNI